MSDLVDVSEVYQLADDMADAVPVVREVTQVVNRAAVNVKRDWQANARASAGKHGRLYPSTISYDLRPAGLDIEAEVGPTGGGQADLAPVLEYGSPTSPPHRDGNRAADSELPRFVQALADIEVLPP